MRGSAGAPGNPSQNDNIPVSHMSHLYSTAGRARRAQAESRRARANYFADSINPHIDLTTGDKPEVITRGSQPNTWGVDAVSYPDSALIPRFPLPVEAWVFSIATAEAFVQRGSTSWLRHGRMQIYREYHYCYPANHESHYKSSTGASANGHRHKLRDDNGHDGRRDCCCKSQ